jgi:dihydrofolate reductase
MIVSAILAMSKNRVIGKDNQIPWHLSADLKYFKRTTLHHHIIMGRKTFLSIGKPLPKRTNIVLTRNPFFVASHVLVASSIEEALSIAEENGEEEVFIIGGGEIYRQSMPYWDKVYLTRVDIEVEGDVFFPELDNKEWRLLSDEPHETDEKNIYQYSFQVYERYAQSSTDE